MKWFALIFAALVLSAQAGEISVTDVEGKMQRPQAEAGQVAAELFYVLHDSLIADG